MTVSKPKWVAMTIVCLALGALAGYLFGTSTARPLTITERVSETITRTLTATITITATPGVPNPASVYCIERGYRLEIRQRQEGQYGVCIFSDGSECDEWAFYRGECYPKGSACGKIEPCKDCPPITQEEIQNGWYWGSCSQKKPFTSGDWMHIGEGTRSAKWIRPTNTTAIVCDCSS